MEDDFILYYYDFSSSSLSGYNLSGYFDDKFLTGYTVRVSEKNIIIEATSYSPKEKTGIYLFKVEANTTGIKERTNISLPEEFLLMQNYPNSFNPITIINYELSESGKISLKVFDLLGREVAVLADEIKPAGRYSVEFNGSNLSSGIYFYKLSTESGFTDTKKLILFK